MIYYDVHTHHPSPHPEDISVVGSIITEKVIDEKDITGYCSFGIHPWHIYRIEAQMALLKSVAYRPEVVAIGEAGLDKYAEASLAVQADVFRQQAMLAEEVNKPLIIHCVKAWEELLAIKKEVRPRMPWIIHGFRGNGELADQLLRQGCFLSFGLKFNSAALKKAWPAQVLAETDDTKASIRIIYAELAAALELPLESFAIQLAENTKRIFCHL